VRERERESERERVRERHTEDTQTTHRHTDTQRERQREGQRERERVGGKQKGGREENREREYIPTPPLVRKMLAGFKSLCIIPMCM